jgi:predicted Zn-dependent protease with MMP-like domain
LNLTVASIGVTIRNQFQNRQRNHDTVKRGQETCCKSQMAIVSGQPSRHIGDVNLLWEQLCAIAAGEIEATLEDLPVPLRLRAARLPVTFEPHPNTGLQADGIAADTLGLFTGAEFMDEETLPLPAQIILFLANIWEFAEGDEEVFRNEVRTTFLHELGHYLGLDEGDLTERGLE